MASDILFLLTGFCLVILIGFISESIFNKTHIPDILILFLIGILIGPILKWISPDSFIGFAPIFVTLALTLILFSGGINIKLDDFLKGATKGSILSSVYFLSSVTIVTLVMIFFKYPIELGILLGAILGGTSSAVVIPVLKLLKINAKTSIILTLESALTDVYCIVGAITVLQIIKTSTLHVTNIILGLLGTFAISIIIGALSAVVWSYAKRKIPAIEKAYMVTLAVIVLIYIIGEAVHGNGAITILSFAIVLGNIKKVFSFLGKDSEYNLTPSEKNFFSEISFFLKVFFFVYLGIMINFSELYLLIIGFIIAVLVALVRPFVVKLTIKNLKDLTMREKYIMSLMSPKGLAAAALVQIILTSPELNKYSHASDLAQITLSVIFFSILINSVLVMITEKKYPASINENKQ
ncbi:MAG: cation:proton antiporter [Nanoarchaeota archaeon]|mgnify:CR=1 FL=1